MKGCIMKNKTSVVVDRVALDACEDGLLVANCAMVKVAEDIMLEDIVQKMEIQNCARVICSEEQKSTLELVSKNVAVIGPDEEDGGKDSPEEEKKTYVINSDCYRM